MLITLAVVKASSASPDLGDGTVGDIALFQQVWVYVDYRGYRAAYCRAFSDEPLSELVLDHILNRRKA
jgi:hypothetical protein